jgi:hypothetical protein
MSYTCGQCRHIHNEIQFETQTPTRWEIIKYSVNAPSPVLSPSNILQKTSSHWALPQKQIRRANRKMFLLLLFPSLFLLSKFFFLTLKLRDLKFRNSGSACTSLVASLPKTGVPGEN